MHDKTCIYNDILNLEIYLILNKWYVYNFFKKKKKK